MERRLAEFATPALRIQITRHAASQTLARHRLEGVVSSVGFAEQR